MAYLIFWWYTCLDVMHIFSQISPLFVYFWSHVTQPHHPHAISIPNMCWFIMWQSGQLAFDNQCFSVQQLWHNSEIGQTKHEGLEHLCVCATWGRDPPQWYMWRCGGAGSNMTEECWDWVLSAQTKCEGFKWSWKWVNVVCVSDIRSQGPDTVVNERAGGGVPEGMAGADPTPIAECETLIWGWKHSNRVCTSGCCEYTDIFPFFSIIYSLYYFSDTFLTPII